MVARVKNGYDGWELLHRVVGPAALRENPNQKALVSRVAPYDNRWGWQQSLASFQPTN